MANGLKNMAFAGADGGAVVARSGARRPSRTHRRDYLVGQRPCGAILVGRGRAHAAAATEGEGSGLKPNRQLKI
jgi:hypothetical protein